MSDLSWFHHARYGMFIHWGPYSVAGRGEWLMNRERIPADEYRTRFVDRFTASAYDPRAWARLARESGMGYVVLTTRHHDGFALWDTATSGFNAARLGPRRDLVRPFVEAVRAEGLRVGLYYSVADWRHPDYPDAYARDWPAGWPDEAARLRFVAYYHAQLRELMTGYGAIDLLWYDGCIPAGLDGGAINTWIKQRQPGILINERLGEPFDFRNSEQTLAAKDGAWEACMTLNDNWGYHAGDDNWKSPREVARMLVRTAASAGNLLLNLGPREDGTVPAESARILAQAGDWLRRNREFLPDSTRSPFGWTNSAVLTTRGGRIYAHFFASPGPECCVAEIGNRVLAVRRLDGGGALDFRQDGPRLFIHGLPMPLADPIATTLVIEVEGEPRPVTAQTTHWIPA